MKCKQQRKPKKERTALISSLLKKLKELNPKRYFELNRGQIVVDTREVRKLNLPDNVSIVHEFDGTFTVSVTVNGESKLVDIIGW